MNRALKRKQYKLAKEELREHFFLALPFYYAREQSWSRVASSFGVSRRVVLRWKQTKRINISNLKHCSRIVSDCLATTSNLSAKLLHEAITKLVEAENI